jgi:hypothetical protein
MRNNIDSLVHLPMVFMAKLHQFFQNLALFSQNLINTNKLKLAEHNLDSKNGTIAGQACIEVPQQDARVYQG